MQKNIEENKPDINLEEYYIAPFLNYICLREMKLRFFIKNQNCLEFARTLDTFKISFQELVSENAWLGNQRKTLVVDIDGTLCHENKYRDYSKCEPIEKIVNKLRLENDKGTYIILFTARNMRTFKGSIGLINKFTAPIVLEWLKKNNIPYDEIIFGKPWGIGGVNYVDDKNLHPEEI